MRTATKMSAYALALAAVFGGAWAAGVVAGPLGDAASPSGTDHTTVTGHDAPAGESADLRLPGLASVDNGYRLALDRMTLATATPEPLRFRILGPGDTPVTAFDIDQDKRLHFIVVRRDGSGFQHLHPEMSPDGTWTTNLVVPSAGSYRVFADMKPVGAPKTILGADIQAGGPYQPVEHNPARVSTVDGYEVRLDGELTPGAKFLVTATVTKNGHPVGDLQPYLGAYGHLVALRATDLGYVHVHPQGAPGDGITAPGPRVLFALEVPTAGRYRLFLDFQRDGTVHTADFTVDATARQLNTVISSPTPDLPGGAP
jgi:hypothetical protein